MWTPLVVLLAFSLAVVESRVTFPTSEVLDNDDLKGTKATATFKCYAGCRVYSPTKNADIVIVDGAGKEWKSLYDLSNLKPGDVVDLPASTTLYTLKNKGADNPYFVFYAVEKGAMYYDKPVAYINATYGHKVTPGTETILTVMSDTAAIRFSEFEGDYSRQGELPTVYAVPADAISPTAACLPVYDGYTAASVGNTDFTVLGPIAAINLKKAAADKHVTISGAYFGTSTNEFASAVYVSPGYVGCPSVGDSLYTFLPMVTSFSRTWSMTDSSGISLTVDGDYSIEKEENALQLTVNGDAQKLYGKNKQISKIYDETSFSISVQWDKADNNSKDRFALQIDALSHTPQNNGKITTRGQRDETTTSGGHLTTVGSTILTMAAALLIRP